MLYDLYAATGLPGKGGSLVRGGPYHDQRVIRQFRGTTEERAAQSTNVAKEPRGLTYDWL